MSAEESFCGTTLGNAHLYYLINIQGYLDTPVFIIGSIFNIFNILVFTRKNMISPVNLILTHLAIVDLSVLLAYVLFVWVSVSAYYRSDTYSTWTYSAAALILHSKELISISNHISVCLIMMLAIWKHIAVFFPSKERRWCNMKTTRNAVVAIYIACVLLDIPSYISHNVITYPLHEGTEEIHFAFHITSSIAFAISMIIKGVLYELLPSVVLAISSVRLIVAVWIKKDGPNLSSNVENSTDNLETKQKNKRSILILLTLVALSLSIVIPKGLRDLLDDVLIQNKRYVQVACLHSLSTMLSILNCINKSVTFIVYYTMDQDFKATFKSLFNKHNIFIGKRKYFVLNNIKTDESSKTDQV